MTCQDLCPLSELEIPARAGTNQLLVELAKGFEPPTR
jgi:hypothetical protein